MTPTALGKESRRAKRNSFRIPLAKGSSTYNREQGSPQLLGSQVKKRNRSSNHRAL
jgi:hypothetical protein